MKKTFPKIAIVYDRVNRWGGAERVLETLHEIWQNAPLFTSVYDPKEAIWARKFSVSPSFLQKIPLAQKKHEFFPYLMPIAFETHNFAGYDIIISVTSEAAKGIITKPHQLHICYCLTPTRYLWSHYNQYFDTPFKRCVSKVFVHYLRYWDKIACYRPDFYIAISETVQKRIKNFYHRESYVIYPPVDLEKFFPLKTISGDKNNEKFFLIVSRLVGYKKIEIAIQAFNRLGWKLKIIGKGEKENLFKKIANKNIEFLGQLTDNELLSYYQRCEAVIFPQEEDFGLVPLEAQACGKPVIAFKKGGSLETIVEGVTGEFFYPQTPEALVETLKKFDNKRYKAENCIKQAKKFSKERFKIEFKKIVNKLWEMHIRNISMR